MLTMLLVDDEYLVRMGLRETIDWEALGITICGEAANGRDALVLAVANKPDIILTDICMPFMTGLELMAGARETALESTFIVLSGYPEFQYVREAMHNGAAAYLLKPIDNAQLVETVGKITRQIKDTRSTLQYYSRLRSELSSIKRQFLLDLVLGNIREEADMHDKVRFHDLPIGTGRHLVACVRLDSWNGLVLEKGQAAAVARREELTTRIASLLLLSPAFLGVMVEHGESEWIVILQLAEDRTDVPDALTARCGELVRQFAESGQETLSIGIGTVKDSVAGVHASWRDACTAAELKPVPGLSSILCHSEMMADGYRREITEAIRHIRAHYAENITVEAVAREIFVSPSYLMHLFKSEVGRTFNECLTDHRMLVAREMLRDGRSKIYEVASAVGYGDVKYFSQLFRKAAGMTPSEYARAAAVR